MSIRLNCLSNMARRLNCNFSQWSSRVFAAEFDSRCDPVYFALSAQTPAADEKQSLLFQKLFSQGKAYSVHAITDDRIQRARSYSDLQDKLVSALPKSCNLLQLIAFHPDVNNSLVKGFFIQDALNNAETENMLKDLVKSEVFHLCTYVCSEDGKLWQQCVWSQRGKECTEVAKHYITVAAKPEYHPSLLNIINTVVYYSFEDAYRVLQECKECIPESKEVLELADQCIKNSTKGRFPVIVIEGLDATGKTTLTQSLQEILRGALLRSPPGCLSQWRARFDAEPPLIRRAFYALGNYISACDIARESAKSPVIVDRYWHSTAAYAIATEVGGTLESLPSSHSEVYRWPRDLLTPDLVVLLTVRPEERARRLLARGVEKTREEAELEANNLFRQKVEEAYRRIQDPACVVIDASPSKEEVLSEVLLLIQKHCNL